MKIVRVIYDWPPPWHGLSPHPYELTLAQVKQGHEVELFCGRWPKAGAIEKFPGVNIHSYIREPYKGLIFFTTALMAFFGFLGWKRNNSYDILHIHGHFGLWFYLHRSLLKKLRKNSPQLNIPLIAHFHNTVEGRKQSLLTAGTSINPVSKYLDWPLAAFSDRLAVKYADALIFAGADIKDEAVKYYGADPNKCFVVESGVNTASFRPVGPEEKEKSRRELGFDHTDRIILNHGYMVERKNIHLLVEMFRYLPPIYKLFLAGPFSDNNYRLRIMDLIEEYKLKDNVVMTGYVPYPDTPIAFQVSDLFILPSSFEGVPKVVMQSLACHVPALVSGFKLEEDIQGLDYLHSLEPVKMADQIMETFESHRPVDIHKVSRLYSWETRAQRVEEVYSYVRETRS